MKSRKETVRHREAFEYYFNLGEKRSLALVGRQLGVSKIAVEKWSKAFNWQKRLLEREERVSEELSKTNEEKYLEVKKRHLKLTRTALTKFEKSLSNGSIKITASDFVRLANYELSLLEKDKTESDLDLTITGLVKSAEEYLERQKEKN